MSKRERCPTCGQPVRKGKSVMMKITKEGDAEAWKAWLSHLHKAGKRFDIQYWAPKGYMHVPTRFPPGYQPELLPES
jgi:2,4-dienoyl-CoA reductase-like NADH-dependent reductase (Old Yellow Enzyme family)